MDDDGAASAMAPCPNCGSALVDEYCAECGQHQVGVVTLRAWLAEVGEELVSVERGIWATLRALLTRPGHLTREWLEGRRARWVRPFRLYLFSTIVFFAFTYVLPFSEPSASPRELGDPADFVEDLALADQVREDTPRALFVMMPFFALLLKAAWPRAAPFIGHLVHSLHLHAIAFFVLLLLWPAARLPTVATVFVWMGLIVATLVYYHISLRRAYRTPWWRVLLAGPVILAVYGGLLTAVLLAGGGLRSDATVDRIDDGIAAHYAMADALEAGDEDEARRQRATALEAFMSDPDFPYHVDARWHLGQMALDAGERRQALVEARQGLAMDSTHLLLLGLAQRAAASLAAALEEAAARDEASDRDDRAQRAAARRAEAAALAAAAADYRLRLLEAWPGELERRGERSYAGRHRAHLRDYLRAVGIPAAALPPEVD